MTGKHDDPETTGTSLKKPYVPPRLETFGDVATLTQNVGMTGMNDPGSGSTTKTGP